MIINIGPGQTAAVFQRASDDAAGFPGRYLGQAWVKPAEARSHLHVTRNIFCQSLYIIIHKQMTLCIFYCFFYLSFDHYISRQTFHNDPTKTNENGRNKIPQRFQTLLDTCILTHHLLESSILTIDISHITINSPS